MSWYRTRPWLGLLARLVLAAIWAWAALEKLGSPRNFTRAVRAYDATPEWLSQAIGYGLPVLELALAVLLLLGVTTRLAASVSTFLFVVFIIGIVQAAIRGIKLDCGCFGGGGTTTSTTYTLDLLRDLGLLVLAVFLVLWPLTALSIDRYNTRHDEVELPSAKRLRTKDGLRKYEAAVAAKRKAARVRETYLNIAVAIVVAMVAFIGVGVQGNRAKVDGSTTATNASVKHGVVNGTKAAATIDVYEDFQCPHCEEFEQQAGAALVAAPKANTAQVRYHPIAILDRFSNGNNYSTRAANAAICASDASVAFFLKYHETLFGKDKEGATVQPEENGNGRSNADFVRYAKEAGLTGEAYTTFTSCVNSETHKALVEAMTVQASKDGVNSTPTIKVNGKTLKNNTLAELQKAIADAAKKGPAPTPAPASSGASSGAASSGAASTGASSKPASSTAASSTPAG